MLKILKEKFNFLGGLSRICDAFFKKKKKGPKFDQARILHFTHYISQTKTR